MGLLFGQTKKVTKRSRPNSPGPDALVLKMTRKIFIFCLRSFLTTLSIKVKPGSFKDEILFDAEEQVIVKIREKPIDGAANGYLIKFLAAEFNLSKSSITIEKGLSSQHKKLRLNVSAGELEKILSRYRK